jgi:hypothetical protein
MHRIIHLSFIRFLKRSIKYLGLINLFLRQNSRKIVILKEGYDYLTNKYSIISDKLGLRIPLESMILKRKLLS